MYCPYKYKYLDLLSSQSQQSILNICFTPQLITTNILQFLHNTIGHHQWLQSKRYDIYFCQYLKLMNLSARLLFPHTIFVNCIFAPEHEIKMLSLCFLLPPWQLLGIIKRRFCVCLKTLVWKHKTQRAESGELCSSQFLRLLPASCPRNLHPCPALAVLHG